MGLYTLRGQGLEAAHTSPALSQEAREEILKGLRHNVISLTDTPLFPLTWMTHDVPSSQGRTQKVSSFLALDATGQIVTVEIHEYFDATHLLDALGRSGEHSGIDRESITRLYPGGQHLFIGNWQAFVAANPPIPVSGPRLIVFALDIDEDAINAIRALAGAGVLVKRVTAVESHGEILISVDDVRPQNTVFALTQASVNMPDDNDGEADVYNAYREETDSAEVVDETTDVEETTAFEDFWDSAVTVQESDNEDFSARDVDDDESSTHESGEQEPVADGESFTPNDSDDNATRETQPEPSVQVVEQPDLPQVSRMGRRWRAEDSVQSEESLAHPVWPSISDTVKGSVGSRAWRTPEDEGHNEQPETQGNAVEKPYSVEESAQRVSIFDVVAQSDAQAGSDSVDVPATADLPVAQATGDVVDAANDDVRAEKNQPTGHRATPGRRAFVPDTQDSSQNSQRERFFQPSEDDSRPSRRFFRRHRRGSRAAQ
ncbi:hypothetical protein [Actinotignum urinale]|uniref:hypothetical protein n=1 Tax=Actinotignum urinale TaxID=190146 RepID=UPI0003B45AA7|nr:hypothetical protein [Actinotignum urinale]MDY5161103.1 hypothetical protein [Actinotignum urinale]